MLRSLCVTTLRYITLIKYGHSEGYYCSCCRSARTYSLSVDCRLRASCFSRNGRHV